MYVMANRDVLEKLVVKFRQKRDDCREASNAPGLSVEDRLRLIAEESTWFDAMMLLVKEKGPDYGKLPHVSLLGS